MTTMDEFGIDIDKLHELVGDKVFASGKDYYRNGNVHILALLRERVLAQVEGTETYRTEVTGRGRRIGGSCSCRAFDDRGVCKHMVATALAANASAVNGDSEGIGVLDRIRGHLREESAEALIEMIMQLAERNSALLARLDMIARIKGSDVGSVSKQLRSMLDRATRLRDHVYRQDASDWANEVDIVLDAVSDLVGVGKSSLALDLAWHAIERIERAMVNIDDSEGHWGALLRRACNIHLAAAKAVRPEPLELARQLFRAELEGAYDTFRRSAALYADVLGDEGLAEFRRLAHEAWETLSARLGGPEKLSYVDKSLYRLESMVDFLAERDGDVECRIALRTKDLSTPWCYSKLVDFCLSQGRQAEALRWAEEGVRIFEDSRPDETLLLTTTDLLAKAEREKDAEVLLQRAFTRNPSLTLYKAWTKLGGSAARETAVRILTARLAERKDKPVFWAHPADLLLQVFMHEQEMDSAWSVARTHGASLWVAMELAQATETTHGQDAVVIYVRKVEQLVEAGGNPAYEEAAQLIGRIASLQGETEQAKYVASLKLRFSRKRNFMKLLG